MYMYVYDCICTCMASAGSDGSAGWSANPGSAGSESAGEAARAGWSTGSIRRGLRAPAESVSESVIPGRRPPRLRSSARPAARAPPPDQALGIGGRRSL